MQGIKVIVSLPVVIVTDSLITFNVSDTIPIFFYGNIELYQISRTRKFETDEEIPGTETYFIYKRGSEKGFWYRSLSIRAPKSELPVDSFLRNRASRGSDFTLSEKHELLDSINEPNGDLFEKYIYTGEHDENTPDSFYYYYTRRLFDVNYSFSKKLDSMKHMKLYKVRFLINEKQSTSTPYRIPKREFYFEIRKEDVTDRKDILAFMKYFEGQQSKQN